MTNEVKVTNIKSLIITILLVVLIVTAGTFAWLSYRSKDTKMVLTIGDINNIQITLKPYQLDLELSPVLSYTSLDTNNEYVTVTVTNNSSTDQYYSLYYDISEIDSSLQSTSFKYTILKSTDNGTTYTEDVTGNFSNANTTDNFYILEELSIPANTTYKYKVYTWVDGNDGPNIENAVFKADLQAELYGDTNPLPKFIRNNAVIDNIASTYVTNSNGVQFNDISSDTNGKGLYLRAGTQNDAHPIYYYRGAVDNNNVLFANFCWKIVRTTDTGGIKLIYNGVPGYVSVDRSEYNYTNDSTYPYIYDAENKTWTGSITYQDTDEISSFVFSVKKADDYVLKYDIFDESIDMARFYVYKNGNLLFRKNGPECTGNLQLGNLSTSDVITIDIEIGEDASMYSGKPDIVFSIANAQNNHECNNTGTNSQLTSTSAFSSSYTSLADGGYMYGTRYTYTRKASSDLATPYLYGNSFTYSNGTYTLVDTITSTGTWSSDYTTLNNNHYTCFNTTGTCSSIYYIQYTHLSNGAYYITLSDGKSVSDAISEMLTNSVNTSSSVIKTAIDNWYSTNMTSYTSYLEDTIYCNDRFIGTLGGWDPNGGDTTDYLYFSPYNRAYTTYTPSLTCAKNDAFTVTETSTGNGALTYPVGLLTGDEVMLAGGKWRTDNSAYYLYTGQDYWLGSFSRWNGTGMGDALVNSTGTLNDGRVNSTIGVRQVVSLRPGTQFSGGTGTVSDPYIVN